MKQAIPFKLLFDIDNHHTLAVWVKLHCIYRHPVFYNFSYTKLAKLSGISHTSLRKHIPTMIKLGWCNINNGNLCFKGISAIGGACVLIPAHENKSEQILEFRNAIIKNNIDKQVKQVKFKVETVKKAKQEYGKLTKKQLKYLQQNNIERPIIEPTLSNKSFGVLINRGKYTGQRLQSKLRSCGYIKTKTRLDLIKSNVTFMEYHHCFREAGNIYNETTKQVFKRRSNAIVYKQNV